MKTHVLLIATLTLGAAVPLISAGEVIELTNGTKIIGTIQKQEGGKVYINADLVGPVVVDASKVIGAAKAYVAPSVPTSSVKQPVPVVEAPPAAPPKAQKDRVIWKRSLSVNGSYNSAPYVQGPIPGSAAVAGVPNGADVGLQGKQSTVSFSGLFARVSPTEALTLTGSYTYAKYEPAPSAVINSWSGEFTYTYVLSPKTYTLARSTYKVDKVALIDHSFEQVVGYGYKFFDTEQTKLDIIPGLSALNEKRGTRYDDEWIYSVGFLERMEHAFNENVSIEQKFKYRVGVEKPKVWAIDTSLALRAKISEHVSFNVTAGYTYDDTLGPLPATLAPIFLSFLTPEQVALLRPAKKGQFQLTSGVAYEW